MCNFKSGLIFKDKVVLAPIYNESHLTLLKKMNIEDSFLNESKMFVKVELDSLDDKTSDILEWKFKVKQDIIPNWYKVDQKRYENEFRNEVKVWMQNRFKIICGELCVKIKSNKDVIYYMTADSLLYSDFGKTNNYNFSYIREKLNVSDFASALKKEFRNMLIPITTNLLSMDGFNDYGAVSGDILALRTFDLHRKCRKNIPNPDRGEWLATPLSTFSGYSSELVEYIEPDGSISGCWCDFHKFVRPFFILKADIFIHKTNKDINN